MPLLWVGRQPRRAARQAARWAAAQPASAAAACRAGGPRLAAGPAAAAAAATAAAGWPDRLGWQLPRLDSLQQQRRREACTLAGLAAVASPACSSALCAHQAASPCRGAATPTQPSPHGMPKCSRCCHARRLQSGARAGCSRCSAAPRRSSARLLPREPTWEQGRRCVREGGKQQRKHGTSGGGAGAASWQVVQGQGRTRKQDACVVAARARGVGAVGEGLHNVQTGRGERASGLRQLTLQTCLVRACSGAVQAGRAVATASPTCWQRSHAHSRASRQYASLWVALRCGGRPPLLPLLLPQVQPRARSSSTASVASSAWGKSRCRSTTHSPSRSATVRQEVHTLRGRQRGGDGGGAGGGR